MYNYYTCPEGVDEVTPTPSPSLMKLILFLLTLPSLIFLEEGSKWADSLAAWDVLYHKIINNNNNNIIYTNLSLCLDLTWCDPGWVTRLIASLGGRDALHNAGKNIIN